MGGLEAFARLSELDPKVRAIISSGYAEDEAVSGYAGRGFKAALVKPYTVRELGEVLAGVLGTWN
jgi:CheY-like chemotaxis protein